MTNLAKKLAEEALLLPRDDRAELVERLLQSLNLPTKEVIENLWAKEAEKRISEYKEGEIKPIDGEQVFKSIREQLKK